MITGIPVEANQAEHWGNLNHVPRISTKELTATTLVKRYSITTLHWHNTPKPPEALPENDWSRFTISPPQAVAHTRTS